MEFDCGLLAEARGKVILENLGAQFVGEVNEDGHDSRPRSTLKGPLTLSLLR